MVRKKKTPADHSERKRNGVADEEKAIPVIPVIRDIVRVQVALAVAPVEARGTRNAIKSISHLCMQSTMRSRNRTLYLSRHHNA